MKQLQRVDFAMYAKSFVLLVRHPTILAMPVLAGVVDWGTNELSPYLTDALGGAGAGLFQMLVQIVYLFAFGIAIIQASNAWRGRRATFDEAWEEGRRKAGGILLAAIGFQFVIWAAAYAGSLLGSVVGTVLQLAAAFFLIYTIPASSIGGMPGQMALAASIRAVRENVVGTAILAIVFVGVWIVAPMWLLLHLPMSENVALDLLVLAGIRAILLAYLAFPFAKAYDDVAFSRFW